MGVTSLTTTPSDLLAKFLFPIPVTLYSAGLEVLVAKEGMLPSGNTRIPLNWELRMPLDHFALIPMKQAMKGVTVLAGVTDPIKGKLDCYSTMEVRNVLSGLQEIL